VPGADSIALQPESQISTQQELERRREIVRHFFNDFWTSTDDKPVTFAERLNRAEGYINERLAVCGEAWQLDPVTRKQLGLPPTGNGRNSMLNGRRQPSRGGTSRKSREA
jgi:hypothetical protein